MQLPMWYWCVGRACAQFVFLCAVATRPRLCCVMRLPPPLPGMQLEAGINIDTTMVRVHLVTSPSHAHLLLLGDHVAFDGRSFQAWLGDTLALLGGDPLPPPLPAGDPLVDWTTRVPPLSLPPLAAPVTEALPLLASVPAPPDAPAVQDAVFTADPGVLEALRGGAKVRALTLNGPLMAAFGAAIGAVARDGAHAGGVDPRPVCGVCAVDVRGRVVPPLPADYVCSAAGLVPCRVSPVGPGAGDLWAAAAEAGEDLHRAIHAGEAFRLHDILTRGAYGDLGPFFSVPFLW